MGSFYVVAEVVRGRAETEGIAKSNIPCQPSVLKFWWEWSQRKSKAQIFLGKTLHWGTSGHKGHARSSPTLGPRKGVSTPLKQMFCWGVFLPLSRASRAVFWLFQSCLPLVHFKDPASNQTTQLIHVWIYFPSLQTCLFFHMTRNIYLCLPQSNLFLIFELESATKWEKSSAIQNNEHIS